MNWWQNLPSKISPDLLEIGAFHIRYYGLMYAAAFSAFFLLTLYRIRAEKRSKIKKPALLGDFMLWMMLAVMAGARLGYVLFYDLKYYLASPMSIISPFYFSGGKFVYTGISGMSYHGGLIAVFIAIVLFCRNKKINLWDFTDFIVPSIPLAYTFGRIGNFINGELYGRATTSFIGMYFPPDPDKVLRHPSQLYEAFFEGLVLFAILWPLKNKKFMKHALMGAYIFGYGFFRFFIEFFRQPDSQLGFVLGPFSMGQVLCFLMMLAGAGIIIYNKTQKTGFSGRKPKIL